MAYSKRCIVTGAAGFIGSALARLLIKETEATVLVVDKLTYAGVPESLKEVGLDPETLKSLNKLCVRLVFCLYAEDVMAFVDKCVSAGCGRHPDEAKAHWFLLPNGAQIEVMDH